MTAASAKSLRRRRPWNRAREPYSARVFFSSILVICAIAALALVVSGDRRPAVTGVIPAGSTLHRRGTEALHMTVRDEEVCFLN